MDAGCNEATDAELVARVRAGELAAYGILVKRHQRAVWRVAVSMLGDLPSTENIVQQCFVDAYESLHQYKPEFPFDVWCKAIARNLVRMELRTKSRQSSLLDRYREQLSNEDQAPSHEDLLDQSVLEAMARCRQELTAVAEKALHLHYEAGQPLQQVALAIERTVVATRQLLFRTRLALRDCVEKKRGSA
jgi:RNA polymerase sigma-70 factor, ECF subfamily